MAGNAVQELIGVDWKALAVAITALGTAGGALVAGIYTGRNTRRKDNNDFALQRDKARLEREIADDAAQKARIDAVSADAADSRKRLREVEDEFDKRMREMRVEMRELERDRDRGWDLARHHFGIMSVLDHLLNNIFTPITTEQSDDRIAEVARNQLQRFKATVVPKTVEEPIPDTSRK